MSVAPTGDEFDCPACGCNDWRAVRSESSTARLYGVWISTVLRTTTLRACNHCGHRWRSVENRPVGEEVENAARKKRQQQATKPR